MTLTPGTRLGPYEILAPLGSGGMGEVYRARDPKLNRDVAIKILPEALAADPAALARFEREAQAVAALSHPNILAIFDFGRQDDTAYAVMELLEGETLRARLGNGALPSRKAVELAAQIAEGLAAAHDKGIVHRDLKPENIFVTHDGRAKVLDFGLAKAVAPGGATAVADPGASMQLTSGHTSAGMVLGTAAYMSPEQVRGEAVDHRSDIFAFGAVLYEMLTGRPAFGRETATESMTAILKEEPPDIGAACAGLSPGLQRIVQHCLEKKPGERFQSARDIAFALQALSGSTVASGPAAIVARRTWRPWLAVMGAAALIGIAGFVAYEQGEAAGRRAAAEVSIRQMSFRPQAIFRAAFQPDGETIVYSAAIEGHVPELFVIRPDHPEPQPLGLPRTHLLSISSKGELAVLAAPSFIAHRVFTGTLAKVAPGSTGARPILEDVHDADWSPDGLELAIIREANGKNRLEFPIGKVLYETAGYLSDVRVSPRGDRVAVFDHPARWDDRGSVIVVDRRGKRTVLSAGYTTEEGLAWSTSGDEVVFSAGTMGLSLTVYGVDLSGHRRLVAQSAGGLTVHDISRAGRMLVTRDDSRAEISVLAPGATAERQLTSFDFSYGPSLSPDGRMLLFDDESVTSGPNYSASLQATNGGPVVRLGDGEALGLSPDGQWVLAITYAPPQLLIYPTGAGESRRLPRGNIESYQSATWFPDGKSVLFCGQETGRASRCYAQSVTGGVPRPVTPEAATRGFISADGSQILYTTSAGTYFIQGVQGGNAQPVPGLTASDHVIRWTADGRGLFVLGVAQLPFRFERMDLASGRRVLVREVAPADRSGVYAGGSGTLTDDARAYAYGYSRMTSQLFVIDGAR